MVLIELLASNMWVVLEYFVTYWDKLVWVQKWVAYSEASKIGNLLNIVICFLAIDLEVKEFI